MLKTKRRDRAVLPPLPVTLAFSSTLWSAFEHAWCIERGQGEMLLETCKMLVESLRIVPCWLASPLPLLWTALHHGEFLLARQSLTFPFQ